MIFTIIFSVLLIYSVLSWALVTYKFWYWFLIPVFPELPEITYTLAIGLTFFIGLFISIQPLIKNEFLDNSNKWVFLLYPWITLLIGYLTYIFII